jgi:hypothetical protein
LVDDQQHVRAVLFCQLLAHCQRERVSIFKQPCLQGLDRLDGLGIACQSGRQRFQGVRARCEYLDRPVAAVLGRETAIRQSQATAQRRDHAGPNQRGFPTARRADDRQEPAALQTSHDPGSQLLPAEEPVGIFFIEIL